MGSALPPGDPGTGSGAPFDPFRVIRRRRRRRRILAWGSASLAVLMVATVAAGYALLRHFNGNIQQDNIVGLLGDQPVNLHPQAENILVIGSDTRHGQGKGYGNGLLSAPTQYKVNEAFAIGNLYGNHTALGVACTVKTVEQNTGIYIDHFVVVNFTGFKDMVAALNGVPECNQTPIDDPLSHLHLAAGHHMLTPTQALGYVRARYTLGDGSDLERIGRQQAFMSSLIGRVKSELLNPLAIYRFLDAATRSVTIDSQLGGITGLYDLGESLRSLPSDKIAFFTLPNFPRGEVVPGDIANVVWTQPEDNQIFASFRDDVPASSSLFGARQAQHASVAAGLSGGSADKALGHSAAPAAGPAAGATRPASPGGT